MKDRMRFRIWDHKEKRYIYDNEIKFDPSKPTLSIYDLLKNYCDKNRYTFEFSTDVRDKKGCLIYEGDIVQFENDSPDPEPWNDVMIYDKNLKKRRFRDSWCDKEDGIAGEIVGNIHQNQRLVEDINEK